MKIWIDLINSPHVNFFADIINDIKLKNNVVLTSRPLANTLDLIKLFGFDSYLVGKHYGKSSIRKIAGYIIRVLQLYLRLRKEEIHIAVSHSSFYSPATAKLLRIPSIYLNDNEHAVGNYFAFAFSNIIMIPEFLDVEKIVPKIFRNKQIIKYPGVKEGVYLWRVIENIDTHKKNIKKTKKTIYIRPEPWTAQYYKGKRNFLDDLLLRLKEKYIVVLLPRGSEQFEYYKQPKFKGVIINDLSLSLLDIIKDCDLFVGAGGTMTREMAVVGTPTISIYQDELLTVDKYLIKEKCMVHNAEPTFEFIDSYMAKMKRRPPNMVLIDKGKQAYNLILECIKKSAQGEFNA